MLDRVRAALDPADPAVQDTAFPPKNGLPAHILFYLPTSFTCFRIFFLIWCKPTKFWEKITTLFLPIFQWNSGKIWVVGKSLVQVTLVRQTIYIMFARVQKTSESRQTRCCRPSTSNMIDYPRPTVSDTTAIADNRNQTVIFCRQSLTSGKKRILNCRHKLVLWQ